MKFEEFDLIELFNTYCILKKLEDKNNIYGNVDYFLACLELPNNVQKLFSYMYMYEVKEDVSAL